MSIRIKNIYKVNRHHRWNPVQLRDDTMEPDSSGSSSDLAYSTMQETNVTGQPLPTYVIRWWAPDLCNANGCNASMSNIREINGFVPPWPPVPYTDPGHTLSAFSYICWNGSSTYTSDSATGCTCGGPQGGEANGYGICASQMFPPDDRNGGAGSTPFYPSGSILINQNGNYGIELILDGFIPACNINNGELPTLIISKYNSINDMIPPNYRSPNNTPPEATYMTQNCSWKVETKQVTVPYNDQTYKTWWPTKNCSTVAPQPSTQTNADGTQSMSFNGVFTFDVGNILQFTIKNTCSPSMGTFSGTIQITPQFITYPI
jgi:hypothetical protein